MRLVSAPLLVPLLGSYPCPLALSMSVTLLLPLSLTPSVSLAMHSRGLIPIAKPTLVPAPIATILWLSLPLQVACGGYHSAAATDAGHVFTWGFNRYGQCGNGSKDNPVSEPSLVDLSRVTPGAVGEVPKVLCGRHHSALVTRGGALYTWGACSFGKASEKATPIFFPALL